MHLIFCVDDNDGISFCGRRLSRDREVYAHMLRLCDGHALWVAPDSAGLFPEGSVICDPDFLDHAADSDYCFVEAPFFTSERSAPKTVILYRWNRSYPSTEKFPRHLFAKMQMIYSEDFSGYSHDRITMERYIL